MGRALREYEYYEFVRWFATPEPFREQKTQQEFQEKFSVSHQTLARWKNDLSFEEDVSRALRKWGTHRTPNVIAALYKRILQSGDATAVKLWLQVFEGLLPSGDDDRPQQTAPTAEEQQLIADIFIALRNYGVDPAHERIIEGSIAEPDSQAGSH